MTSVHDVLNLAVPAGAYDDLLTTALPISREQRVWQPSDGRLPALFVSHGAPPTLDDPRWLNDLLSPTRWTSRPSTR
jgi:4,5-DOPA dioxygenase extradiol